eukprot:749770-Hanusia_phi.AAC.5
MPNRKGLPGIAVTLLLRNDSVHNRFVTTELAGKETPRPMCVGGARGAESVWTGGGGRGEWERREDRATEGRNSKEQRQERSPCEEES